MINRREFVQALSMAATGFFVKVDSAWAASAVKNAPELLSSFVNPGNDAKPWVYWFWINGNLTREGITADLEAMHRVGIGGVLIFEVDPGTPIGNVPFGSEVWKKMFQFACEEAHRLDIEITMYNAAGWAGSGGPWITPELSMQKVVWSEISVEGPRHFDEELPIPKTIADFYREIAVLAFPALADDSYRIPDFELKTSSRTKGTPYDTPFGLPISSNTIPEAPNAARIDKGTIHNISGSLRNGKLSWEVPAGKWTIVRFGYTTTGEDNHPTPVAGRGLECDKLSKAAIDYHFAKLIGDLAERVGPLAGKTLVATHVDSWECGGQSWTPLFREEFQKRCGYDVLPFLPAVSGRVVGSREMSERFLWDFRKVIGDLLNENYAGRLRELAHAKGMRLSIEGYDWDPADEMSYGGQADEPQGEFWFGRDTFSGIYRSWSWCYNMVSAAHVYGRHIAASEAFTANPGQDNWRTHPALLKPLGDWALSAGINKFVIHRFAMQPWLDRRPGMTMGPWGIQYERTQTWWEESTAWHEYLTRCQFMLRQGLFVADLCYLQPEGAPMRFRPPGFDMRSADPPYTPGYNFDGCTPEVVLTRMSIKDGRIVLPDGMNYQILVLPEFGDEPGAGTMTPELLGKIKELVEQGMTLVGSRPSRSPSLSNYPSCDQQIEELVNTLWADCDGERVTEHKLGKGRVVCGRTPEEVLAGMGIPEDFSPATGKALRYIHRRMEDGTEIYFVANAKDHFIEEHCKFRVSGLRPEFWWPERAEVEMPATYEHLDSCVSLPIALEKYESVFVVFRPDQAVEKDRIVSIRRNGNSLSSAGEYLRVARPENGAYTCTVKREGTYLLESANGIASKIQVSLPDPISVVGPWKVHFAPNWGAPESIELPRLISWSEHNDPGVRHFSGKAVYQNAVDVPAGMSADDHLLFLDLGEVANIARVKWNGKDLGILWRSPFVVDITSVAKTGTNSIEIMVVNTWANRLIGDANLPEDCEWQLTESGESFGQRLSKWPSWLLEGKPSPTGRYTFATWKFWKADSQLLAAGLLGPVTIYSAGKIKASIM
jgi:hypothetical protein